MRTCTMNRTYRLFSPEYYVCVCVCVCVCVNIMPSGRNILNMREKARTYAGE